MLAKAGLEVIESGRTSRTPTSKERLWAYDVLFVASGILSNCAITDDPDEALVGQLRQEQRRAAHVLEALENERVSRLRKFSNSSTAKTNHLSSDGLSQRSFLSEVIASIDEDLKSVITGQVLDALAMFETHGLYHVDLRLWNVLFNSDDGVAHIIDYGALSPVTRNVMWPNDAYFSFLVWLAHSGVHSRINQAR